MGGVLGLGGQVLKSFGLWRRLGFGGFDLIFFFPRGRWLVGGRGWIEGENELAFRSFWAVRTLVFVS